MKTTGKILLKGYLTTSVIVLLFALLCACSKSGDTMSMTSAPPPATPGGSGGPPANEVWIQGSSFIPSTVTVAVNTTVKWTNKDGTTHTVTSDSPLFDSGNIGNSGTYSFQFTATGSYNYHCNIHSTMTGKVIVQ
jgi:plastocyanin